jgi:hypothetical protein
MQLRRIHLVFQQRRVRLIARFSTAFIFGIAFTKTSIVRYYLALSLLASSFSSVPFRLLTVLALPLIETRVEAVTKKGMFKALTV